MLQDIVIFLLYNTWILLILSIIAAFVFIQYSNQDNILKNLQLVVPFVLYLFTINIILITTLILCAIVFFPSIQNPLANLFTSISFVLSLFAIAITIGYSTDNYFSTPRFQRDILKQISIKIQEETSPIQKIIENNHHQLLDLIQNQNPNKEEIITNDSQESKELIQAQNITNCNQEAVERDEFIFNLISNRNSAEFERSTILDNKASGVIGFAGIIIGLLGALISFLLEKLSQNSPIIFYYQSFRVILLLGIIALAGAIFCCLIAYSIKTYSIVPDTSTLIEKYAKNPNKNKSDIIQVVGLEISQSIKDNTKTDDEKAKFVKYGLLFFTFGMAMIVIFVCGLLAI